MTVPDTFDKTPLEETNNEAEFYSSLVSVPEYLAGKNKTILKFDYRPQLTNEDLDRGRIIRYFARRSNVKEGEIIEISESQKISLETVPLYDVIEIPWKIKGRLDDIFSDGAENRGVRLYTGVITANTEAIEAGNRKMPGISQKLSDPLQFYQGTGL